MAVAETRCRVMASRAHVIVVDGPPEAGNVAHRALDQLERRWSRFVAGSDIDRLNHSRGFPIAVDGATLTLVETMVRAWQATAGRLDPTVLPALLRAGYRASIDDPEVVTTLPAGFEPADATMADVVIDRPGHTVTLPEGLVLDPGGIGKGLAADLVVAELLSRGSAGALVGVGGDLAAAGTAPSPGGWPVAVEDPFDHDASLARLEVTGGGVATASTVSRCWIQRSAARHHLIDPATGAPTLTDLAAVTVVAPCGWQAEAHATALTLGGTTGFRSHAAAHGLDAIATTLDGRTMATDRLAPLLAHPSGPTGAVPA